MAFIIVITTHNELSPNLFAKAQHALISGIAQTDVSGIKVKKEVNAQKNNTINDEQTTKEGQKDKKVPDNKLKTKQCQITTY